MTDAGGVTNIGLMPIEGANGQVLIPSGPLVRLNFYDGMLLRASNLKKEQDYLRLLIETSNLGGGSGVVHGFGMTLTGGDQIVIQPGLAIDAKGRVLLLPAECTLSVASLLSSGSTGSAGSAELSGTTTPGRIPKPTTPHGSIPKPTTPHGSIPKPTTPSPGDKPSKTPGFLPCGGPGGNGVGVQGAAGFYVICLAHAEAWCGQEDVYGRLCEQACVTSTDRPYINEGVVVQAVPLKLTQPLPMSTAVPLASVHLRSRLASALFAQEVASAPACLRSKAGLTSNVWCLGADLGTWFDCGVPLGVIARAGQTTLFLDVWSVRRERIEAPARRYWAWRTCMRPWDVFLAHILQFQCQLAEVLSHGPGPAPVDDPCLPAREVLGEAKAFLDEIAAFVPKLGASASELAGGMSRIQSLQHKLSQFLSEAYAGPSTQILLDRGIGELPPTGYLPVDPASVLSVNQQVRRLLGKGLDLRFCVVRPDFVAHALEEAQHMDRISLLHGLDHPDDLPKVDVLVPNGVFAPTAAPAEGAFEGRIWFPSSGETARLGAAFLAAGRPAPAPESPSGAVFVGAAHGDIADSGAATFAFAGTLENSNQTSTTRAQIQGNDVEPPSVWITVHSEKNLLTLSQGDSTAVSMSGALAGGSSRLSFHVKGDLTVKQVDSSSDERRSVVATLIGGAWANRVAGSGPSSSFKQLYSTIRAVIGPDDHGLPSVLAWTFFNDDPYSFTVAWGGTPLTATARLEKARQPDDLPVPPSPQPEAGQDAPTAQFRANAKVLEPSNPFHMRALEAIQTVATALADPAFVEQATALLFPSAPVPSADSDVKATTDWVLFHRRRDKDCGTVSVSPVPKPAVSYQVYVGESPPASLEDPSSRFSPLGIVQFAGESAQLITPVSDIQVAWQQTNKATNIVKAGASEDAERSPFPLKRIGALEEALKAIVTVAPDASKETFSPLLFDPLGADGSIAFVVLRLPAGLLKVEGINLRAVKNGKEQDPNAKLLTKMATQVDVMHANIDQLNLDTESLALEVVFTGAELNRQSITSTSFNVYHTAKGKAQGDFFHLLGSNTVRFVFKGKPEVGGYYNAILSGSPSTLIRSTQGKALDGGPMQKREFPSGNDAEGGGFALKFVIAARQS